MKSALILIAIAMSMVLGLAIGVSSVDPIHTGTFSVTEQLLIREEYPGGRFLFGDSVYERCENQWKIRYYADGTKLLINRTCWK